MPQDVLDRLGKVEDALQEIRFVHMVKVESTTNGMATLWSSQKRLQEELSGFRAEVTAHLGAVDTRLSSIESALAEVLRRLPEPDEPAAGA